MAGNDEKLFYWARRLMPIILAFWKLRQETPEFKASLVYIVRPCIKGEKKEHQPTGKHQNPILCSCSNPQKPEEFIQSGN